MKRSKFLIPILLLLALVLTGANCGEKKEEESEKQEEQEEQEEQEKEFSYSKKAIPEGFPQYLIYPQGTCCYLVDSELITEQGGSCGVAIYSKNSMAEITAWYEEELTKQGYSLVQNSYEELNLILWGKGSNPRELSFVSDPYTAIDSGDTLITFSFINTTESGDDYTFYRVDIIGVF